LGWTAPHGIWCQSPVVEDTNWRPSITNLTHIAIALRVYAARGWRFGRAALQRYLRRGELSGFFARLAPVEVALLPAPTPL